MVLNNKVIQVTEPYVPRPKLLDIAVQAGGPGTQVEAVAIAPEEETKPTFTALTEMNPKVQRDQTVWIKAQRPKGDVLRRYIVNCYIMREGTGCTNALTAVPTHAESLLWQ